MRYNSILQRRHKEKIFTAILFRLEFEKMCESMGCNLAFKSLKTLGKYISEQMDSHGGFSARQSMDQILTILPHTEIAEAQKMLDVFAKGLNKVLVCNNKNGTDKGKYEICGFEINVYAGVTESRSNEDVEKIIIKAKAVENIIAQYRCETRRELQSEKV